MSRGMVLVLSIWDDYAADMLWLDSDYPTTASPFALGVARGSCATSSDVPGQLEGAGGSIQAIYSNIKFGDIGSTYNSSPYVAPGGTAPPTTSIKPTTYVPATASKPATTTSKPATTTNTSKPATTTPSASGPTQYQSGQCGDENWA
ncbi:hypothetical protein FRB96_009245 [Tulasnella sp. 330]|nr:hypothetical protein FRB96_009245 [Tulasnella sp. 330]